MTRVLTLAAATAAAVANSVFPPPASAPPAGIDVGHGLSIVVPPGWRVSHRRLTPCSDPVERFSLAYGRHLLMVQERLAPTRAELAPRPRHFAVHGRPGPLECCSLAGRSGWLLAFGDHGRALYAYVYPGGESPAVLLRALDSLRVRPISPAWRFERPRS